ncbi:hypothetical protein GCM10023238_06770 [Streptomyces heliomycini]
MTNWRSPPCSPPRLPVRHLASRLPALKDRFDLGGTEVGLLLTAAGVGAAVSFPLVAPLMRRLGARRLALWSALVLVAVLPVLAAAGAIRSPCW